MHIPIAQLSLENEESETVLAALASGMTAQGPVTIAFEEEFVACCGVSHAVAASNGITALRWYENPLMNHKSYIPGHS